LTIEDLIDQWDPVLRRAFLDSIREVRDGAQIEAIARMLERGDVEGAVRAVGLNPVQFSEFDRAMERAFEAGGKFTASSVPTVRDADGLRVKFQFNVRNPDAEAWLRDRSSTQIREILDDQRQMIRSVLRDGMERGVNPRTAALDLVGRVGPDGQRTGGYVGLTESQSQWVRNYEAELRSDNPLQALSRKLRDKRFDSIVRRAAASEQPIRAEDVQKMVTAYRNRALRYRAETIARTEAMASLHQSQDESMRQAVDQGIVEADAVTYIWRTASDKRVRESHADIEGQRIGFHGTFVTGRGARLRYPGDPNGPPEEIINCRCWREPKVDFLRAIEEEERQLRGAIDA
jgi:hypothetical protein